MKHTKKKILIANDASFLASGYGVYGKEILSRLHNSDKYEVAELGCYATTTNTEIKNIPWKFYPNAVNADDKRFDQYKANGANQFGAWRFNRAILDFKANIVCIKPNTLVHTKTGYRPISDIKIGDYVMSHSGHYRKVLKTMKRQHNGVLVSIKANADFQSLSLTEEHPVLVYKKRNQTNQKKSIQKIYEGIKPQFIPAKNVEVGDLVVLPKNKENYDYLKIHIADYLVNYTNLNDKIYPVKNTNTNGLNNIIDIDYDFGVLIGYIIGDGCILNSGITITFHLREESFATNAQRILLEKFGLESVIRTDKIKNCLTVICNSVLLSEFLTAVVGTKADKKVPSFCWTAPANIKQGLIKGLFCSDGCYKKNTVSFTSIHKHLAYEVRQLCADLSIPVCINKCAKAYNVEGYGESAILLHNIVNKNSIDALQLDDVHKSRKVINFVNGDMVASIKKIIKKQYSGQVYNLEVDIDNSYVANWCVHNCDVRDYWMYSYQETSPFKKHFNWVIMPTVDSAPQRPEWLYTFSNADIVVPYTDWAKKVLTDSCGLNINLFPKIANAGINPNEFYPIENKEQHKINIFGENKYVVGAVMRNQKRKLFADLFEVFRKYLDKLKSESKIDIYNKSILYLHTSYPEDNGWDFPTLLLEYNLLDKVYFSYVCRNCKHFFPSKFQNSVINCPNCKQGAASFCSVSNPASTAQLNTAYNLFDIFLQYAICLGKDEQIRIKRNDKVLWMPISQVKIGDEAWTHNNRWKPIVDVWKNLAKSHNKRILELSVHGDYETLIATEDHEFPAFTQKEIQNDKSRSVREKIGDKLRENKSLPEATQYDLASLKSGDMLLYPIDDTVADIDSIDISKEIDCSDYLVLDSFIETSPKYSYPRFISINEDFCRFVGLFAADGCWESNKTNRIKITSHINEIDNQHISQNIFASLSSTNNVSCERVYKNRQGKDDLLCSTIHTHLFAKWFSKHEHKKLPDWVMYLPLEKQKMVLQGLFMGDGHFIKEYNTSVYCTISSTLADQLKHILRRLRISFNARKVNKPGNRKPQYRFEVPGNIKDGEFLSNRIRNTRNTYYNNQHLIQIKNISVSDYNDDIWCVTVNDDHTMTTKISATKNCEGLGIPQLEAAACGVPIASVDYSAMTEIAEKLGGIKIPVKKLFREMETNANRAYPDNDFVVDLLYKYFINTNQEFKNKWGAETRQKCYEIYTWDNVYKVWEEVFDSIDINSKLPWDAPVSPTNHESIKVPPNLNPREFIEYICYTVINDPNLINTAFIQTLIKDMQARLVSRNGTTYVLDYNKAVSSLEGIMNNKIALELMRTNPQLQGPEDYLQCQQ